MTREEAIEILQEKHNECKSFYDLAAYPEISYPETGKYMLALRVAIAALRPVSREQELEAENKELKERIVNWRKYMAPTQEQVEKVWRAHWNESTHLGGFVYCSRCGYNALEANNYTFCPACGAAQTDEAVQMVMERLEALHNG